MCPVVIATSADFAFERRKNCREKNFQKKLAHVK
jgi:hypothetical protein